MARLTVTLLGAPRVERDGILLDITIRKAVALLAYLAATGVPHTRDRLATFFWPEADQERARGALRYTLAQLKVAIGDEWLHVTREQIALNAHGELSVDVAKVDQLWTRIERHGHPPKQPCAQCVEELQAIVALQQGALLSGFTLPDSPDFDDWLFFESERLQRLQADALTTLIAFYQTAGNVTAAIPYAQRLVALDPLQEKVNELLIQLYAENGQQAAALRHYELFTKLLRDEFGAEPDQATTTLVEELTSHRFSAAPPPPMLATAHLQQALPTPASPLLGRAHELSALGALLDDPACRLLTLLGPGGSGKTRLALALAHARQPLYPHAVHFIALAGITHSSALVTTIASATGCPQQNDGDPRQRLLDYLRERQYLLILDNLEHLLEGSGDQPSLVVELLDAILVNAPDVQLVVTSRVRLHLEQEQLYPVQGLDYPEWESSPQAESYGAVQLFVQRARRVLPHFELTAATTPGVLRIVRLLAGQPLAIELAAVWVASLAIDDIAAELSRGIDLLVSNARNIPARHRSMRTVFDYSWQLASPTEQSALRRLAPFAGAFSRVAAQQVAGVTLPSLLVLLDKSLLQSTGNGRFRWHPLVRQYALERLDAEASERKHLWQQYLHYYLGLLKGWSSDMLGRKQKESVQAIEQELDNIQPFLRSLDWQEELPGSELAFYTLFQFYRIKGRLDEFIEASDVALARLAASLDNEAEAEIPMAYWHLLAYQACGLVYLSRYEVASNHFEQVLAKLAIDEHPFVIALCRRFLGIVAVHAGDFPQALRLLEVALAAFQALGQKQLHAEVLNSLGVVSNDLGDFTGAIYYLEQSIVLHHEVGNAVGEVYALSNRAATAFNLEHQVESRGYLREALAVARDAEFNSGIMLCLAGLADVANSLHDYQEALVVGAEALALTRETRDARQAVWVQTALGIAELGLGHPDVAREHFCRGIAAGVALKVAPRTLEAMVGLAHWQKYIGENEEALRLLAFCLHHPSLQRKIRDRANRLLGEVEQALDAGVKEAAFAENQSKSLEQVADALLLAYNATQKPLLVVATNTAW